MTHSCPCCGRVVFREPPGSYDICPICFWEDDIAQLRWPDLPGGANKPSLVESQRNVALHGAMEGRFVGNIRSPADEEPIEPGWRPIDLARDAFEPLGVAEEDWPVDPDALCYWRPTFWRRRSTS